jgi:hypothetical protein
LENQEIYIFVYYFNHNLSLPDRQNKTILELITPFFLIYFITSAPTIGVEIIEWGFTQFRAHPAAEDRICQTCSKS